MTTVPCYLPVIDLYVNRLNSPKHKAWLIRIKYHRCCLHETHFTILRTHVNLNSKDIMWNEKSRSQE